MGRVLAQIMQQVFDLNFGPSESGTPMSGHQDADIHQNAHRTCQALPKSATAHASDADALRVLCSLRLN
jgi:hypothetical protein